MFTVGEGGRMAFDWSVPVVMLDLGFCGVGRKTATLCILLTLTINQGYK